MIDQYRDSLLLRPEARSSAASRQFIARALARWQLEALTETAILLTSEVVTNAIVHAQSQIAVTITRDDYRTITVAVTDRSRIVPRLQHHVEDSATGRGLGILDSLASSWTVVSEDVGKTVKFTLRHPSVPEARTHGQERRGG